MLKRFSFPFVSLTFALFCSVSFAAETFRVATYNVENYLDQPTESRPFVKSAEARGKVRESIHALNPDVIALEEMGSTNALLELRASLKARRSGFSVLGTRAGLGHEHSRCHFEPVAHRCLPTAHQ